MCNCPIYMNPQHQSLHQNGVGYQKFLKKFESKEQWDQNFKNN
jgi:hypothetical protein